MNPFRSMKKGDYILWISSLTILLISNLIPPAPDPLTIAAAMTGITALIFAAKGNVWGQFLIIVFSILYGIISFRFRYWGEMVTYLGMTLPMAVWASVTWLKNPADPTKGEGSEVGIRMMEPKHWAGVGISTVAVTALFWFILKKLDTPNLAFSTLSVTTSFAAAALTMLRSSYYALFYGANDVILIVLWVYAATKDIGYLPVAVNFVIFLVNDIYGFVNWKARERK